MPAAQPAVVPSLWWDQNSQPRMWTPGRGAAHPRDQAEAWDVGT